MLSADYEKQLVAGFQEGSADSLRQLLSSHLRLVLSMARRYVGHGASLEDLIGEGNLGLVEAARRFDAQRGVRFGTYAAWWVRAYVRRYALANRRIVATPSTRNARRILGRLRSTQRSISQSEGRPAERHEVAMALGVSESDVAMVESALSGRDVPVGPTESGYGFEVANQEPSPEQAAAERESREVAHGKLFAAMKELSDRERVIVQRRWLDEDTATLAALGQTLGLSRERVRQLEKRAQRKLRAALLDVA